MGTNMLTCVQVAPGKKKTAGKRGKFDLYTAQVLIQANKSFDTIGDVRY